MNIYTYTDYRILLKDKFLELKSQKSNFSMSTIARRLNQSPMSIKYLLDQKRHIADEKIDSYIEIFQLNYTEGQYFRELVKFNKAKNIKDKNSHFERIINFSNSSAKEHWINNSEIGIFKDWYYTTISELSYTKGFKEDAAYIQSKLNFQVSKTSIYEALNFLKSVGFLKGYPSSNIKLKLKEEFVSHIYKNYHYQQLSVAKQALEKLDPFDRNFHTITISLNAQRYELLEKKLNEFRHELHNLLSNEEEADRVVQISLLSFITAKTSKDIHASI